MKFNCVQTTLMYAMFQHAFTVAISSLLHSGIYHKFEKDIKTSKNYRRYFTDIYWIRENLRPNKPLSVDHTLPSFIMLGLGIIPATIIFFLEVFHSKFKKKKEVTGSDSGPSRPQENTPANPNRPIIVSQQSQEPEAKGKAYKKISTIAGPTKEIPKKAVSNVSFDKVAEKRDAKKVDQDPSQPLVNSFDHQDDPDIETQPY